MTLKLTHISKSRSTRTLWLLHEIGCSFELKVIASASTYAALHPTSRVPALQDGDVTIHETGAMTEWLCETRAPHLWRRPGAQGRIGWLDWLHFGETLAGRVAALPEAAWDTARSKDLGGTLNTLGSWLEGSEWLLEKFSGVDCQVGYSLWLASQAVALDDRPALTDYLKRCGERPAFRKAFQA